MKLAILKYMIMFDASNSWSSGYQFENQLADFFAAYGYQAEIIEPRGGSGERVIVLTNIDPLTQVKDMKNNKVSLKPEKQQGPQKILKEMTASNNPQADKFNKGKFLKTKGYLKK